MCESASNPFDLDEQEPRGCRYVHGHPGAGPWFYCQAPIAVGGRPGDVKNPPYCDAHRKLTYLPQKPYNWVPGKYDKTAPHIDKNVVACLPGAGDGPRLPVDLYMNIRNRGLSHD